MWRIIYMVLMNLFHAPIWLYKIGRMGRPEDRHTKEERYEYIAKMDKRIIRRGSEYYVAAEPPVRCGVSHLSGLTEPLI